MEIDALLNSPWFWIAAAWSLAWKGVALWRAARLGSKPWFVALMILNTVGLLDILYLGFFSKMGPKAEAPASER